MTTTNQEPTMTTPTPPTWMTCDHRGIGLPGCPTCDGRLDPEPRRLLLEAAQYAGGLLAAHVSAGAALKEALRIIEQHRDAEAIVAVFVGALEKTERFECLQQTEHRCAGNLQALR